MKVEEFSERIDISHRDYTLVLFTDLFKDNFHQVIFSVPYNENSNMAITGRDVKEYHKDVQELFIDPYLQYLEIGAGMGGFIPYVARFIKGNGSRPIIIDPADYVLMKDMLEFAYDLDVRSDINYRILKLLYRCKTILDEDYVNLINLPLGEALEKNKELEEIADVVIDHIAASFYPFSEKTGHDVDKAVDEILDLEKKLLKPNGKLLRYCPKRSHA